MAVDSESRNWTIGEVARRTGVPTSALRYYEAAGALPEPRRREGQERRRHVHRTYDDSVFLRVALIQFAQAAGFSVTEIAEFVGGVGCVEEPSERWRELAKMKLPQIETLIARASEIKCILEIGLAEDSVQWNACQLVQETAARCQQGSPAEAS